MIYVDSREPDFVLQEFKHQKAKFKVEKLDVGDITNEKRNVILERKRPEDIGNRILNRKWDKQMQAMYNYCIDNHVVSYLMVEGSFEDSRIRTRGKLNIPQVRGAIISASVRYFCSVWFCRDLPELVYNSIRICKKADERKLVFLKKLPFERFVKDRRIGVLINVCQVSSRQAEILLKGLGSVKGVLLADKRKLMTFPYIGPATAKRICAVKDSKYR